MTDLEQTLRNEATNGDHAGSTKALVREAADRIATLERELGDARADVKVRDIEMRAAQGVAIAAEASLAAVEPLIKAARAWFKGAIDDDAVFGIIRVWVTSSAALTAQVEPKPLNAEEQTLIDKAWERHRGSCLVAGANTEGRCYCTRKNGHDGPCAAPAEPKT